MKVIFSILIWIINPIISTILVNNILYRNKLKYLLISMTFGLIAYTQISTVDTTDYDILRYYSSYNYFEEASFKESIYEILKKGDYIFYLLIYCISKFIKDNPQIISFIMVSLIYYFYFLACIEVRENTEKNTGINLENMIFVSIIFILNFPLISNAFRSYLAFNLFLYSLFRFYNKKKYRLILFFSVFIHWSTVIFLPIFSLKKVKRAKVLLILCIFLSIFSKFFMKILVKIIGINFFTKNVLEYSQVNLNLGKSFYIYFIVLCFYLLVSMQYFNKNIKIVTIYILSILSLFFFSSISIFRYTLLASNYSAIIFIASRNYFFKKSNFKMKKYKFYLFITVIYCIISFLYLVKNYLLGEYIYEFNILNNMLDYFDLKYLYYKTI